MRSPAGSTMPPSTSPRAAIYVAHTANDAVDVIDIADAEVPRLDRKPDRRWPARSSRPDRSSSSRRTEGENTVGHRSAPMPWPRSTRSRSAFGRMVSPTIHGAGGSSSPTSATPPFRGSYDGVDRGRPRAEAARRHSRGGPNAVDRLRCRRGCVSCEHRGSSADRRHRSRRSGRHPTRRPDPARGPPRPGHRCRPAPPVLCLRCRRPARDRCGQRHDSQGRADRRGARRRVPRMPACAASTSRSGIPASSTCSTRAPFRRHETIPTEPGAHTLSLDAARHLVCAFLPASHRAAVYEERA